MDTEEQEVTRTPLTKTEYYSMQCIFGMMSEFSRCLDDIKTRAQSIKGVWRDLKLCQTLITKCQKLLLKTVPTPKLQQIKKELAYTYTRIHVGRDYSQNNDEIIYIERDAMDRIVDQAMKINCFACNKCGREARKCQLRKDIEATYQWDIPSVKEGMPCHFADSRIEGFLEDNVGKMDSAS